MRGESRVVTSREGRRCSGGWDHPELRPGDLKGNGYNVRHPSLPRNTRVYFVRAELRSEKGEFEDPLRKTVEGVSLLWKNREGGNNHVKIVYWCGKEPLSKSHDLKVSDAESLFPVGRRRRDREEPERAPFHVTSPRGSGTGVSLRDLGKW